MSKDLCCILFKDSNLLATFVVRSEQRDVPSHKVNYNKLDKKLKTYSLEYFRIFIFMIKFVFSEFYSFNPPIYCFFCELPPTPHPPSPPKN